MKCTKCGFEHDFKFCPECGEPAPKEVKEVNNEEEKPIIKSDENADALHQESLEKNEDEDKGVYKSVVIVLVVIGIILLGIGIFSYISYQNQKNTALQNAAIAQKELPHFLEMKKIIDRIQLNNYDNVDIYLSDYKKLKSMVNTYIPNMVLGQNNDGYLLYNSINNIEEEVDNYIEMYKLRIDVGKTYK